MSKVSAICSAYYCYDYLDERIRNLLNSTLVPEIVIVCQKDSKEFEIAKKYPCIINVTPDIPTVYKAWNIAVKAATGDYILIANSDDKMWGRSIEFISKILDDNPDIGLVYSNTAVVTSQYGEPVSHFELKEPDADLLDGCYIGHVPCYRKSLHDKYGMYDESFKIAGDYEFWLRLQKGGVKFYHIKEYVGEFWDHKDNLEYRSRDRLVWENAVIQKRYRNAKL